MVSLERSRVEAAEGRDAECVYRQVITGGWVFSDGDTTALDCPFPGVR